MNIKSICMLGGTGFVGRHLATRLANRGYQLKVLTRHPQRHRDIEVLPGAQLVEADIHDPTVLQAQFAGCDAVINLVGILHEVSGQTFTAVHGELPGKVADACHAAGVKRLLHMSALRADAAKGPSQYLLTKGAGEQKVMQAQGVAVTCFKPSIIFAPNDNFFNQFANLLKSSPVLPLACPNSRFAPVYVGDVAAAFEKAWDGPIDAFHAEYRFYDRLHPEDRTPVVAAELSCLKGGEALTLSYRLRCFDGVERRFIGRARVVEDAQGGKRLAGLMMPGD